jgi:hypothetical protein
MQGQPDRASLKAVRFDNLRNGVFCHPQSRDYRFGQLISFIALLTFGLGMHCGYPDLVFIPIIVYEGRALEHHLHFFK